MNILRKIRHWFMLHFRSPKNIKRAGLVGWWVAEDWDGTKPWRDRVNNIPLIMRGRPNINKSSHK